MKLLKIILIPVIAALLFGCGEDPYKNTKGSIINGGGGSGGGGDTGGGTGGGGTGGGGGGTGSGGTLSTWGNLSLGSPNSITSTGKGYDALIVHTSASKEEYYSGSPAKGSVTLSTQKTSSAYTPEENNNYETYNLSSSDSTMSPEAAFHLSLRMLEKEMLEKGLYKSTYSAAAADDHMPCNVDGAAFKIWDTRKNDGTQISIKAVAKSEGKACYYVQEGQSVNINSLQTAFENTIYEKVTTRFGPPSDVDENGHINIVFYNIGGFSSGLAVGGYFSPGDQGPYSTTCGGGAVSRGCSNQADVIYINSNSDVLRNINPSELVAHEFQHLTFNNREKTSGGVSRGSNLWLNESLAMLSATICGYGTTSGSVSDTWLRDFFSGSSYNLSLTNWVGDSSYGYATIFSYYLNDVFGEDVTKRIYDNLGSSGIATIEAATASARDLGGGDFNEIFKNFAQALYLSNTNMATDKKFKITTIDIGKFTGGNRAGLKYKKTTTSGSTVSDEILPYSFSLVNISGQPNAVTIQAPDGASWAAYGGALQ